MAALDQDPYLRDHIVQVWDVANVILNGRKSTIVFEEYMDPNKYQSLYSASSLNRLTGPERLKLVEQLCNTVDRLAEHKIYHHDLSNRNIYINFETKQIKIGDFGSSNFALDVKKDGVAANSKWVSPERELYKGGLKDPGLPSEVFSLSALSYYILTGGDMPYATDPSNYHEYWPSKRPKFKSKSKKFETGFYPESREDLKRHADGLFGDEQLDRIASVFEKGLALKANERYQSGKELMRGLNNALFPKNKIASFVRESSPDKA